MVNGRSGEAKVTEDYLKYFETFTKVSKAIHGGEKTSDILDSIVVNIKEILTAKGCIFWIVDESAGKIVSKISHGFSYRSLEEIGFEALMTIFDRSEGDTIYIKDARYDSRIPDLERLGKRRVGSVTGLFFDIVGSYTGILGVYFHDRRELHDKEFELVRALGEQGAIALHKAISYDEKMMDNLRQVVEGLTIALEAKDERTHGHSVRVAQMARMVGRAMHLSETQCETLYHGGLLHDIGKIGMADEILQRLGVLSRKERDRIRLHPEIGARITRPLVFLNDVEPLILHHHECYDGSGYPQGLRGEEIPEGARILTICDAFETMVAGRKYLAKMSVSEAVVNMFREAGRQFDRRIVAALLEALLADQDVIELSEGSRRTIENHLGKLKQPASFETTFFL